MHHRSAGARVALSGLGAGLLICLAAAPPAQALGSGSDPWLRVDLGVHRFGRFAAPTSTVALARAGEVAMIPGNQAAPENPRSFQVLADGSVWLLDGANDRALVWAAGRPTRRVRTVPMPPGATDDFAVGRDGSYYTVSIRNGAARLYACTADGHVRWHAALTGQVLGLPLRFGPDGALYRLGPDQTWIPQTTAGGAPLTPGQQVRGTLVAQPLPGGRRLQATAVSRYDYRFVLQDSTGARLRAWRLTSRTAMGPLIEPPTLIGDDLVIVAEVHSLDGSRYRSEYQVVRVSPRGAVLAAFAIDSAAAWGEVIKPVRVGPDGAIYALVSSPAAGARIVRYPLAATAATSAPAPPVPGRTPTGEGSSGARPAIWVLGVAATAAVGVAAAVAALAGRRGGRRFHQGRAVPAGRRLTGRRPVG